MTFNRLFLMIAMVVNAFVGLAFSMDVPTATITIANNTPNKLQIVYKLNGEVYEPTLVKKQEETLVDFPSFEKLYVIPYGWIKGKISLATLSAGLLKDNLLKRNDLNLKFAQLNNLSIRLTVKPGGEYLSYLLGRRIAGELTSYVYQVEIVPTKAPTKDKPRKKGKLLDAFPQVKDALMKDKKVEARYFLNVGEHASQTELAKAHDDRINYWLTRRDSDNPHEKALAQEAIEFIEEAYKKASLPKAKIDIFDELTADLRKPKEQTEEEQATLQAVAEAFAGEADEDEYD